MFKQGSAASGMFVGDGQPFLLLAHCDPRLFSAAMFEPSLRRMGLSPSEPVQPAPAARLFDGASYELRFAEQRALAGRASSAALQSVARPAGPFQPDDVLLCAPSGALGGNRVSACRELFKLAVLLIDLTGADQLYWSPAGLWSSAAAFREAVAEMLASGMPPVLHLVAFAPSGCNGALRSQGLAFFAGQEMEVRCDGGLAPREVLRRLARLAIDIMVNGAILAPRDFSGLTKGERIRAEPSTGSDGAVTLFIAIESE